MKSNLRLLVFSDLDGTLLDHRTYQWTPAKPALAALARLSAGVVLASSKTAPEIVVLRAEMGLAQWPAIVENGAGILPANAERLDAAPQYKAIRSALGALSPQLRRHYRGFGDMSVEEIAQVTGLPPKAASLARERSFSEPGLWQGTPEDRDAFKEALGRIGVTCIEGGRFLTLSLGHDKAYQMRALGEQFAPDYTIALGDAPNDLGMLQTADFGVIIANPDRTSLPKLDGEERGEIIRTKQAGPLGWNAAILDLLDKLDLQKD